MRDASPEPAGDGAAAHSRGAALGSHAARGMVWMTGATLLFRVCSLFAQIALARLLLKDDFGVYAMALTIWGFVQLLANPGLDDVLISRPARLHIWLSPGFWMACALGLLGTLVMLAAAPIAAAAYGDSRVLGVMAAIAPAAILGAPQVAAGAALRAQLRFKAVAFNLAFTNVLIALGQVTLAYTLAGRHLPGALALAIPIPVAALVGSIILWTLARPKISRHMHVRRWRHFLGDSMTLFATRALATFQSQSDRMILGVLSVTTVVGVYFFAFQLSTQVTRLLAGNLSAVLFPGLTALRDQPERQALGALNAARLLAFVGMPAAFLQAACAEPIMRLFFDHKWDDAIVPVQLLSIAMGLDCASWPAAPLLQSQRRFRALLMATVAGTISFLICIIAGAMLSPADHIAIGVASGATAHYAIAPALTLAYVLRLSGVSPVRVLPVYLAPLVCSSLAIGAGWWCSRAVFGGPGTPWMAARMILLTSIVAAAAYAALTLVFARHLWHDLFTRTRLAFAARKPAA